eukprot:COSAG06_NODE_2695_length_6438_cov_8.469475_2_plen_38_part_00
MASLATVCELERLDLCVCTDSTQLMHIDMHPRASYIH